MNKTESNWFGIKDLFFFGSEKAIDWSTRPQHRRWSRRKLGDLALRELIAETFSLKSQAFLAHSEGGELMRLDRALKEVLAANPEEPRWLVDPQGRWIMEFFRSHFTLEQLASRRC